MERKDLLTRRDFLRAAACGAALVAVSACTPPTPTSAPTTAPKAEPTAAPKVEATAVPKATTAAPAKTATEFTFWYPIGADTGQTLEKEFNDAGLGIKAKWEAGEYDSNTKTMASLAAGNPPPLSYLGRWQHCDLAPRGAIYALDDRIAGAKNFKWENIWERMGKESMMWGKKWVMPYTTDTRALFYNKKVMKEAGLDPEKPPKTWAELQEMAVKITKKDEGGRITKVGFTPTFGNPPVFVMFWTVLWCLDGSPENDELTKVTLMDKGPQAMEFLKGLMDAQGGYAAAGAFTKALTLGEGLDAFSTGNVALAMNGNGNPAFYKKYSPDLDYGFIAGPVFPEYNINANYDGGGGWYFFKQGKGTEEAWQFLEFWMKSENQLRWCDKYNQIPSDKNTGEAWAKINEKDRRLFVSTANTVRWPRLMKNYLEYCGHVATAFDNIMIGGKDIKAELQAAQDKMQPILDEHTATKL